MKTLAAVIALTSLVGCTNVKVHHDRLEKAYDLPTSSVATDTVVAAAIPNFVIDVSSNFTGEEQVAIAEAANTWNGLGHATITLNMLSTPLTHWEQLPGLQMAPKASWDVPSDGLGATFWGEYEGSLGTSINREVIASFAPTYPEITYIDVFRATVAHEMGHLIGLWHTEDRAPGIMFDGADDCTGRCPTVADRHAYCKVFGCDVATLPVLCTTY